MPSRCVRVLLQRLHMTPNFSNPALRGGGKIDPWIAAEPLHISAHAPHTLGTIRTLHFTPLLHALHPEAAQGALLIYRGRHVRSVCGLHAKLAGHGRGYEDRPLRDGAEVARVAGAAELGRQRLEINCAFAWWNSFRRLVVWQAPKTPFQAPTDSYPTCGVHAGRGPASCLYTHSLYPHS